MRFRKRPVVIEAVQHYPGTDTPGVCWCENEGFPHIHTLEGIMRVSPFDWIITGVKGEQYPCRADIFEATYEAVV